MPQVEQKLPPFQCTGVHSCFLWGLCYLIFSSQCIVLWIIVCPFVLSGHCIVCLLRIMISNCPFQRRIQDFKLGGVHLKKLCRTEGGAKIFGVFRVKNHDYTPKNLIFSNCGGRRENIWGISCEKSRFYAKKSYFFQF